MIENRDKNNNLPQKIGFLNGGNLISVQFEVIQNTLVGTQNINIFIEKLPIKISTVSGFVDLVLLIPSNETCTVENLSIESWSDVLDEKIEELEKQLMVEWNDSTPPNS